MRTNLKTLKLKQYLILAFFILTLNQGLFAQSFKKTNYIEKGEIEKTNLDISIFTEEIKKSGDEFMLSDRASCLIASNEGYHGYIPCEALEMLEITSKINGNKNEVDKNRLRITKATREKDDYQIIFEYNSDNQLDKISKQGNESVGYIEIEYNSNKRPVKIIETREDTKYQHPPTTSAIEIQWTDNGFILVSEESNQNYTFVLNTQGRIIKLISWTGNNFNPNESFSTETIFNWIGDDNLIVDKNLDDFNDKFEFNKINHPYSGINISIIFAAGIGMGKWEIEWQNEYCISEYSVHSFLAKMEYTVNEQNYPTVMDVKYGSGEESFHEFWHFEYELY